MDVCVAWQPTRSWLDVGGPKGIREPPSPGKIQPVKPTLNHAATTRKSKLRASSCPLSNRWIPTRALLILFIRVDRLRGSAFRTTWANSTSISLGMPCMFYEIRPTGGMQSRVFAGAASRAAARQRIWLLLLLFFSSSSSLFSECPGGLAPYSWETAGRAG